MALSLTIQYEGLFDPSIGTGLCMKILEYLSTKLNNIMDTEFTIERNIEKIGPGSLTDIDDYVWFKISVPNQTGLSINDSMFWAWTYRPPQFGEAPSSDVIITCGLIQETTPNASQTEKLWNVKVLQRTFMENANYEKTGNYLLSSIQESVIYGSPVLPRDGLIVSTTGDIQTDPNTLP